ncbi:fatty acid desaturase family protein [Hufsiella ginkgonis]|uniref:Acyl-CoA desaturase n=1 Tax=Hufsiella ginkgonis TaxID=2695274 RepID=A0A7K1Y183_9SPHI|nr:acyl-CoA desaturase [Hufsiella ginkgonis]MXV16436.1 acyl-CoA desaturase [Hufsiella ginkgonis]
MSKVTFNNTNSPFFKSLKEKVNNYFEETQLPRTGGRKLFIKGMYIILSAIAIYVALVFFTPPAPVAILLCCLFGCNMAAIGFNIMHEGGHGSFSSHKWINEFSGYSLNVLGGTIHFWKQKHNIDHHTYTNIKGMDHDIDVQFMRLHAEQPKHWYHRFQHLYFVLLYGISYMAWILYEDFVKYFSGKMGKVGPKRKLEVKEHLIFWLTKATYVFIYLVLPLIMVGWLETLIGYTIACVVCGLVISTVFQLAHVVEGTQFPEPDEQTNKIQKEWAIHQVSTTANFATRSKIVSWFLGGLNFQVEHHLFPGISHVHYPQINKLVKETCHEFSVAYLEHRTMAGAILSHLLHIKKLGSVA